MNKVISINLGGMAFQLEEAGYEALRRYLEGAGAKLSTNPDKDEILADMEQAIADKFRALLGNFKNVVTGKEVDEVIRALGAVDDGSAPDPAAASSSASQGNASTPGASSGAAAGSDSAKQAGAKKGPRTKRLYRLDEGAMLFGVCSGLAAFTGIDAMAFRIGFVALTIGTWGGLVLVYLALVFILPLADSPDERSEAQGPMPTAQDFVRRAKEGYYEAMKGFPDRQARREWKRKFKRDMHSWGENFKGEMRGNVEHGRRNWDTFWTRQASEGGRGRGLLVAAILTSLVLVSLCGFALFSALTGLGSFFSAVPPPFHIIIAVFLVVAIFQLLFWPVRLLLCARFGGACRHCGPGFGGFLFFLLIALGISWWLYPEATKTFIDGIPPFIHNAVDTIQAWWARD